MGTVISIDTDLCENEQQCEAVCPENVFAIDRGIIVVANPSECTICFKCAEVCSNGAIELDF